MDGSGTHCLCPWFPVLLAPLAHQCRKSSCYRSWNQRQVGTTPLPSRISQIFVLAFFRSSSFSPVCCSAISRNRASAGRCPRR
ncbi:hypothetical protein OIU78_014706 [Salix suchowensis]|nr:hypothetical protein OIU78_014706 [Salix suchowensis]